MHHNTSARLPDESLLQSAHVDTFARDSLPPRELWPSLANPGYPPRLNAAVELLDGMVDRGFGGSACLR